MSENTELRKLTAIMFTDMVGYSAMAQRDDQLALELLEEHRALLRAVFPNFRGHEIKTIGDAFLVEFGSALEAAQCAIEIQRVLAKRNHDVSSTRRIELRIGVHIGDVVHRGGDVYGDGVNIASRIEPLAGAGGICVSMDVERQIRNALEARFERLGPTDLKNIKLPMELFRIVLPWETGGKTPLSTPARKKLTVLLLAAPVVVVALIVGWFLMQRSGRDRQRMATAQTNPTTVASPARAPDPKSIAVLPFANLSVEKDGEFFTDGVHEDLLTALAKVRDLKVISRTSVLNYRDAATRNLKQIASDLGVAHILEGSVRRAGNQARITVQLIDARTDQHLWAETYDRDLTNLFAVQSEVAREITTALRANLTADERTLIAERPTRNQEAYNLFVRARALGESLGNLDDRERYEEPIRLYEQAVAMDPQFAQAYARLSMMHGLMYWFGHLDTSSARAAKAKAALEAALHLAPDRPETRLAQGVYFYRVLNEWARAREEFVAADAGRPNDAQVLLWLGLTERRLGHNLAALGFLDRSMALNPLDLETAISRIELLSIHRRYSDACALAGRMATLFPNNGDAAGLLANAQLELDGDVAAWERRITALPQVAQNTRGLRSAYVVAMGTGNYAEADRILADPQMRAMQLYTSVMNYPVTLHQALVAFLRGDRARARERAEATIAYLQAGRWSPRQEYSVSMGLALAHALCGHEEEAIKLARASYDQARAQDAFEALNKLNMMGQIYALLDRKEEAFGCLREMMGAADSVTGPEGVRHSFGWSRLKDDPRFEEILKLAKPL